MILFVSRLTCFCIHQQGMYVHVFLGTLKYTWKRSFIVPCTQQTVTGALNSIQEFDLDLHGNHFQGQINISKTDRHYYLIQCSCFIHKVVLFYTFLCPSNKCWGGFINASVRWYVYPSHPHFPSRAWMETSALQFYL